jgi:polyisoprenoid-binding protein YceI
MFWKLGALVVAGLSVMGTLAERTPVAEPNASPSPRAAYVVDAVHSSIVYRVKHMNIAYFYGTFNKMSGEINLDEKNPAGSSVAIEIDADSIDSNSEGRDRHLKGQDFFSVREFPKITFKTKSCAKKGEDWELQGELTLRGVTKPLTVMAKQTGAGEDPRSGPKAGFESEFTFKRSDFGMTYGVEKGALSDEVKVMIAIEAALKK